MGEIDDYWANPARRPHKSVDMAYWQQGEQCALCGWQKRDTIHNVPATGDQGARDETDQS